MGMFPWRVLFVCRDIALFFFFTLKKTIFDLNTFWFLHEISDTEFLEGNMVQGDFSNLTELPLILFSHRVKKYIWWLTLWDFPDVCYPSFTISSLFFFSLVLILLNFYSIPRSFFSLERTPDSFALVVSRGSAAPAHPFRLTTGPWHPPANGGRRPLAPTS